MSKMDGHASRTASDIERKYNFGRSFSEIMGIAKDAQTHAVEAERLIKRIETEVLDIDVVKELNASAEAIILNSNRLVINSDKFSLTAEGELTARAGEVGGWEISEEELSKNFVDEYGAHTLKLSKLGLSSRVIYASGYHRETSLINGSLCIDEALDSSADKYVIASYHNDTMSPSAGYVVYIDPVDNMVKATMMYG